MGSLDGKTALITGASRGIGRSAALALAREGAAVALVARSPETLKTVAAVIGEQAVVIPADLAEDDAAERVVASAVDVLGHLDIFVNAAGVSPAYTRAENTSIKDFDTIMQLNVRAPFLLLQEVGRRMLERGRGAIVNIASVGALVALPRLSAYCASKGAILQLTRVLAVEWAERGVRVNAVAPGWVRTEMTAGLEANEAIYSDLVSRVPARRFADPDEIDGAIVFLASDASQFVSGQILAVDGAMTA